MSIKIYSNKSREGFTVVELIVAMSIFAVFLGIIFGVFVQAVNGQRELTRFMAVQNNAGLVLEQMMREMRTGYWFCGKTEGELGIFPCENTGTNLLAFMDYLGHETNYALDAGAVKRNGVPLTSGEVEISRLQFLVTQQRNVCVPPRITVLMQVGLAGAGDVAPVNLETTVSPRVFPADVNGAPENVRAGCGR
ncbi:MAG: type II secretion system protein [Candidatus Jorgensenbacteria bacterium]